MKGGGAHIIMKVDQPKIISAQISEQKILIHLFLLKICIISINLPTEKPGRYVELL
jgi:hypothetical protein